jgi:hypothetical protein
VFGRNGDRRAQRAGSEHHGSAGGHDAVHRGAGVDDARYRSAVHCGTGVDDACHLGGAAPGD